MVCGDVRGLVIDLCVRALSGGRNGEGRRTPGAAYPPDPDAALQVSSDRSRRLSCCWQVDARLTCIQAGKFGTIVLVKNTGDVLTRLSHLL